MQKTLNPLQDNFVGEFVEVLCEMTVVTSDDTRIPLSFSGYFIDYDKDNYYFGDNPLEVKRVVRRELVGFMEKIDHKTDEELILDSMEEPEDETEFN